MSLERTGLDIVTVASAAEATAYAPGSGEKTPHLVRVSADAAPWHELRGAGLAIRPVWITWVAPAAGGTDALLARQTRRVRLYSRSGLRCLDQLDMAVEDPIRPETFDEWRHIYRGAVSSMRWGLDLAGRSRDQILAPDSVDVMLTWRVPGTGELAVGCIARPDHEVSAFFLRYMAVAPAFRAAELPRGVVAASAGLAERSGLELLSMGTDINYYGAVVKPGLNVFKSRLGLTPVPTDVVREQAPHDVAERVLSVADQTAPVMFWEYPDECQGPYASRSDAWGRLQLVVVADHAGLHPLTSQAGPHRLLRLTPDREDQPCTTSSK